MIQIQFVPTSKKVLDVNSRASIHVHPLCLEIYSHFVYRYTLDLSTRTPFLKGFKSYIPAGILKNSRRSMQHSEAAGEAPFVSMLLL